MANIISLVSFGIILAFLLIGFFVGLIRGVKRSAVHIAFVLVSIIISLLITKPIINAILGISINIGGESVTISNYIINLINENFIDLSNFDSASAFIQGLPSAVASPIVFMLVMILVYFVIDIIYLIFARIVFGKKKKDLAKHKAHRWAGGLVGVVEACLFTFVLFAPITSLTNTYAEIAIESAVVTATESSTITLQEEETDSDHLQTISEIMNSDALSSVNEMINAFNNSAIGKLCSIASLDDKIFDSLASVKVNGQKVYLRSEIVTIANVYDSFVNFYNNYVDGNYSELDFSELKTALTQFINNGLFKAVLADTIKDVVVNFEDLSNQFNINLSDEINTIISNLKTVFSAEGFDAYTYISHDLLKILDVADIVVSNIGIQNIIELNLDINDVLTFATENEQALSTVLTSFAELNLLSDNLTEILNYANNMLSSLVVGDGSTTISINTDITIDEFKNTITALIGGENSIIYQLSSLNSQYNILSILDSENLLEDLIDIEGLDSALVQFGALLDDLTEIALFNYEDNGQQVNTIENIISLSGISLLGDTFDYNGVTYNLNSYEAFFSYISEPIKLVIDSGLTDLIYGDANFNDIIDNIANSISNLGTNFLSDLLMPFYYLENANIGGQSFKDMIFGTISESLTDSLSSFVTLPSSTNKDDYDSWDSAFCSVAELIDILNTGEITLDGTTTTYLKYLFSGTDIDYLTLIKSMNGDSNETLSKLLNTIFSNAMFEPLNNTLFSTIDSSVSDFTKVEFETSYSGIYTNENTRKNYITAITSIISNLDDISGENLSGDDLSNQLLAMGALLDILKDSANNGVFDELFNNLIWYLTNDVANVEYKDLYQTTTSFDYYEQVKNYLDAKNEEYVNGYYSIDYSSKMQSIADCIDFGSSIIESLTDINWSNNEEIIQFVSELADIVNDLTDAEETISTATDLIKMVLDENTLSDIKDKEDEVSSAIDNCESLSEDIKGLLKDLFGIASTSND